MNTLEQEEYQEIRSLVIKTMLNNDISFEDKELSDIKDKIRNSNLDEKTKASHLSKINRCVSMNTGFKFRKEMNTPEIEEKKIVIESKLKLNSSPYTYFYYLIGGLFLYYFTELIITLF